jgi:hypothetical protein
MLSANIHRVTYGTITSKPFHRGRSPVPWSNINSKGTTSNRGWRIVVTSVHGVDREELDLRGANGWKGNLGELREKNVN